MSALLHLLEEEIVALKDKIADLKQGKALVEALLVVDQDEIASLKKHLVLEKALRQADLGALEFAQTSANELADKVTELEEENDELTLLIAVEGLE